MKNYMILIILAGIFIIIASFYKVESSSGYKTISAEEAKVMIDKGGVTIVDVRSEAEYNEKHIPNAILIPVGTITDEQPQLLPDKDAIILVYCRSGNRSVKASLKLVDLGYTNIYNMGGINNWKYETISEN